eukprot:NODE_4321_length_814_cov_20.966013_g3579_i0.p4 GENE.NODE_4321_length_814_cov_20.966013_g3579_i0~~NODE_4321_length_814_cov_20.966013_g3579_i0.p4  ORF type:complete len:68 (-),score=0.35 NODE_4321_length_814_cov_20.966013_g3579_i0:256-459(-)
MKMIATIYSVRRASRFTSAGEAAGGFLGGLFQGIEVPLLVGGVVIAGLMYANEKTGFASSLPSIIPI